MSIYFKHHPERNFMFNVFHGHVSDDDLHAHVDHLLKPAYDQPEKAGLVVLCDNMLSSDMSFQGIFSAGRRMHHAGFRENGKLTIVANSTVSFGLAKTYAMATEVLGLDEIRVMRGHELDGAMQWLGVSDISNEIRLKISQLEAGSSMNIRTMSNR